MQGAGLTTLEPCLVQARVSGGFPVQEQVKAASVPMSTTMGLGSDSSLGPTVGRHGEAQPISTQPLTRYVTRAGATREGGLRGVSERGV